VVWNVFHFLDIAKYVGSVNNATWQTLATGTVMCTKLDPVSEYTHGSFFWHITASFKVHPAAEEGSDGQSTWNPLKVLATGTYERAPDSDTKPAAIG